MNHHANMKISHRCVDGVDMDLEFFTFEANALTVKDYDAAWVADMIYSGNAIKMSDYSYNLKEESIAKYPASPRGSSKLLHVDGHGRLSYYKNFSESIGSLLKGSHVVFNDSRVLDARLFVDSPSSDGQPIELMLLDLGQVDTTGTSCNEVVLRAMIRSDQVKQGDFFKETSGGVAIEVKSVEG
jgi:S-adenosylmethionine:tRNA-ribosyltransferase-isomerase (queuine synthetase)